MSGIRVECLSTQGKEFYLLLNSSLEPGPTHDLARTLQPLDLQGYYFISQGALAHH